MMNAETVKVLAIGAGVAVVGVILYKGVPAAAKAVGAAVDPTSDKNVFYRGANAVVGAVTGDKDATVGTKLWDVFNRDVDKQISDMLKGTAPQASYDETDRLAKRYPAPAPDPEDHYDPASGVYLGNW
jgi:hypothetical protein